ncbi:MAG: YceI family protein [Alphaproteobacteria bacterium]|nr:MAG: YceI family protein [Alphaproteobacteria bacterium]
MRISPLIVLFTGFIAALPRPLSADETGGVRCWRVEEPTTRLEWTANWAGTAIHGGFSHFAARIRFSPEALEDSSIVVHVPLAALVTEDPDVRELLTGDEWFAPDRFPEAVYESARIRSSGDGRYHAEGTLTLKGVRRPLGLDFTLIVHGDRARAEGGTVIDRRVFGVGGGELDAATAPEVTVGFSMEAKATDCADREAGGGKG